ncbi:hypothetical protein BRADI_1g68912v3, partial [Brachypodium distachyon]
MSEALCPILCWNVRGLNNVARRAAVCELATAAKVAILCLQETKLASIDDLVACETAGPSRRSRLFLPADGTRGGVAIFWDSDIVSISSPRLGQLSLSAIVTILRSGLAFNIST